MTEDEKLLRILEDYSNKFNQATKNCLAEFSKENEKIMMYSYFDIVATLFVLSEKRILDSNGERLKIDTEYIFSKMKSIKDFN